ncbi:phage gp6-like head-tail connector protein [Allorhodopirellula heiligendammensis]|uniref:Phage gp6-like head-tail connector protein n=1 Tax=Allorhodopirellula heiligendammensis TaxID=2714739 RepID=A0A5C6C698_9BACT|nr:phage gp6-like head-tail connector protein [Allorhodopirellula heiligendammensis]TWU19557.1 hypothetical protein Poly21_17310 [Allorhodopirellula heiligendammensis]
MWTSKAVATPSPIVPLSIIKRHARIFDDDSDGYLLEFLLPAAVATVERDTRWQIAPLQIESERLHAGTREIDLPIGPFVSATIKSIDAAGNENEEAGEVKHDGRMPGRLLLPAIATPHTAVVVTARIGSAQPEPSIALMICALIAHWHEHPEAVTADGEAKEVPLGYSHLARALDPMRDAFTIAGAEKC